jgi:undecaprenyl-diphosphatase
MEELIHALIIAIVQGITEWVPVSSSGHLVLVERLLGFSGGLEFNVALHFGTLMSVFVYFGRDITNILEDLLRGRFRSENGRLGILLIIATIPAGIVGYLFKDVFVSTFENMLIVGVGFGVTGLFLILVSFVKIKERKLDGRSAFAIGLAQIFSLIPGISRSGSTLGTGLLFGMDEKNAVKFSFLMSIPVIFGANILAIGNNTLDSSLVWATLVAFFVGLLAIHVLYKYVLSSRRNLVWFGVYALLLGVFVSVYFLGFR